MGNFSSKESHGATGGHNDTFHTPPTSPASDVPSALQLKQADTSQPPMAVPVSNPPPIPGKAPLQLCTGKKSHLGNTPATPMPPPDWKPPPPVSPNSPAIGGSGAISVLNKPGSCTALPKEQVPPGQNGAPATSTSTLGALASQQRSVLPSPSAHDSASPVASPSGCSRIERDSGLSQSPTESCSAGEAQREEMERMLEQCRTTLGITWQKAPSTAEMLKCLLTEINSLRSNFKTERSEWLQFQTDLQVAVAVADRLRAEAEEELMALRTAHKEVEKELAVTHQRQKEADMQLETLRGELIESRQKLAALPLVLGKTQVQALTEPQERPDSRTNNGEGPIGTERGRERGLHRPGREGTENRSRNEVALNMVTKGEESKTDSRGVVKRYVGNVSSEGGSREMSCTNQAQKSGNTERSRSLSRVVLSSDSHTLQNGTSQSNTSTPASYANRKNSSQPRGQRCLDWPESSSTPTGKREEFLNKYNSALSELPATKSQDGFNMLLRRHGGSKRNSLLRWCQNRTLGYKNIDITNFSSSWADGLAFCAVYHTYLPSHIPYSTLSPEDKRENLNLAFKTGENFGITRSLTTEEMLRAGGPDWQRVLSYVESMYRHFEM